MEENWKPINGFEKYFISDLGRVRSLKRYKEGRPSDVIISGDDCASLD